MEYRATIFIFALALFFTVDFNGNESQGKETLMKISSTTFGHNEKIPKKYTCDGSDVNPPVNFRIKLA